MSRIVSDIECPNCGAPLKLSPGELVATCRYCGYTSVVGANTPFQLEHSLIVNELDSDRLQNDLKTRASKLENAQEATLPIVFLEQLRLYPAQSNAWPDFS